MAVGFNYATQVQNNKHSGVFHTRRDRRYTFLQNRCTVFSAIFDSLVVIYSIGGNATTIFFFYPIKETVPCNIRVHVYD